jgi:hypothetical protein
VGVVAVGGRADEGAVAEAAERTSLGRLRAAALAAMVVAVCLATAWLVSPRFSIDTPSLIDDWSAISRSPHQVSELVRLHNPEEQRFRPSWILWNEVQWHTFDGPTGFVGPNAWNLARMVVLVAGLSLLTLLAMPSPRTRVEAVLQAVLAALPALLVATVPKFARDLARFGVQEPLFLGGLALGGSLLVLAVRALLTEPRRPTWQPLLIALAGAAFWLIGVYQKEASLSALPLLAAAAFAGRSQLGSWRRLEGARRAALIAIGAIFLLPLVHVGIETVRIAGRGDLVYGTKVDQGKGIERGFHTLYDWSHEVFSLQAQRIMVGALLLAVVTSLARRKLDVVVLGVLASGALTLVYAAQTNVAVSRYYLPAYALATVAIVLSLARWPVVGQVAGLLLLLAVVHLSFAASRDEVNVWVAEEDAGAALVSTVAGAHATGCPVAVAGLDEETTDALPVLVALEGRPVASSCASGDTYLVLRQFQEGVALARACAPGEATRVLAVELGSVYRCARLRERPIRDPYLGKGRVAPAKLVELRLLQPAL